MSAAPGPPRPGPPVGRGPRPAGITALSIFFLAGSAIALTSCVALLFPGSPVEPMWRVNPRAREAFGGMGPWAVALMAAVSVACASTSVGLWKGARWGHRLATALLVVNLLGDTLNVVLGVEPRAVVGIPIAAAIVWYLSSRRVRRFFPAAAG